MTESDRLFVSAPDLRGNEAQYVLDAIESSWISSTGAYVERFEREFAAECGMRAAVSVVNGTAALHLAMLAHGAGPGDEVIVPSMTYIATANAVRYQGAEPVFADVEEGTWCIDPESIEAAITARTRGIIVVHLYGHPADMDAINDLAARHGLWVVEDAAEAFGATYRGRPAGSLATMATFSFYGNKILTSGEGGAVTVDDPELERRIRRYRGQGMDPQRRYYFPEVGYNYRLTNVACAMLCAQLERREEMIEARKRVINRYRDGLRGVDGVAWQPTAEWAVPAPWLFGITVDHDRLGSRERLAAHLDACGIETRPFFIPIHTLPPYRDSPRSPTGLGVTDRLGATGLSLPTSSAMSEGDVDRVASAIVSLSGVDR